MKMKVVDQPQQKKEVKMKVKKKKVKPVVESSEEPLEPQAIIEEPKKKVNKIKKSALPKLNVR